ncbi:MAG TPA: hypothetical protein VGR20_11275 [Acidimicrobiia bacterium]|nr:hypothetical protein [Acidimicrobiia bacterium]
MQPTSDHLDDEILSALLDEDAGASHHSDVVAHLRACDLCAGRQAELAGARAALAAAPVEPLDELTRRRLLAGALQAADEAPARSVPTKGSRWGRRHPALIGSAAAVLLAVLVGVPFVVGRDGGSKANTSLSAAPGAAREESAGAFYGDLGDLTDHDRLRLRLSGAAADETLGYGPVEPGPSPAAGGATPAPAASAAPVSGGLAGSSGAGRSATPSTTLGPTSPESADMSSAAKSTGAPPPAEAAKSDGFSSSQAAGRDRADTDSCVAALLNGPARGGRLTATGTGTWRGRPAIVAAFELSGGTVAFVADRSGCAVLDRFAV